MKKPVKMAWNEPGGSKDDDPWGGSKGGQQGPPDLDEVVRKIQAKFGGIFGGGKGKGTGGGGTSGPGKYGIGLIVLIIVAVWGLSGFYIIDEGTRGVVLQFGKYNTTTQPGFHWHIPYPVQNVEVVNIEQVRTVEIGYRSGGTDQQTTRSIPREALMLTQDENIVDVNFAIQYQVKDAKDYLFNVRDPDLTLGQVTESAIREIIGKSKMDFVLTEGRSEVVQRGEKLIQDILDLYNSGLQVISLNMQDAQPPEQVQAAFSDAVKAREDRQRSINEAEAYSNSVIPRARGARSRMLEEAKGYKQQVIEKAEGETSRFQQVLDEYEKAPEVTRERLYLDTIEEVMNKTSKVMLDVKQGGNILFLPLDRLLQGTNMSLPLGTGQQSDDRQSSGSGQSQQQSNQGSRNSGSSDQSLSDRARALLRSREIR